MPFDRLRRLERLRSLEICVLAPGLAFIVCGGRVRAARLPANGRAEIAAALAELRSTQPGDTLTPDQAEDLLLVDRFARRATSVLTVLPPDVERIATHLADRGRVAA